MKNMLTPLQAFQVMTAFLDMYYRYSRSDQIGALLGAMDMNIFNNNQTADPAIWEDWIECLNNNNEPTIFESFQAAKKFVEMRYSLEPDHAVISLIHGMYVDANGAVENPVFWEQWMKCVSDILKK
jgi:deoxyadenosine/deoxycytidine kinase